MSSKRGRGKPAHDAKVPKAAMWPLMVEPVTPAAISWATYTWMNESLKGSQDTNGDRIWSSALRIVQ